jgi:hypothetical protein
MFRFLLALGFAIFCYSISSQAQGCVAVRPMGCGAGIASSGSGLLHKGDFQVGVLYRNFKSYKHFRGDSEEKERVELGTEVINLSNSVDLSLGYGLTSRLSLSANLPYIAYDRSSLYEHYGNSMTANPNQKRFHTAANGIGDLRLSSSYWLLDPMKNNKHNLALGLGLKLPTGNSNVQDEFHKRKTSDGSDTTIVKAVDQSIQLGDGGVGLSLDLQGYSVLSSRFSLYLSAFYMSNPKEINNTVNRVLSASSILADSITQFHSVADQFALRMGVNYLPTFIHGVAFGLGVRAEGVPAKDLIGGSWGFRRPGYIISAEPTITFQKSAWALNLSVPYALYRNRVKSVADLSDPAGLKHGDAAFANYLINIGINYKITKKHKMPVIAPAFKDVNTPKGE